MDWSGCELVEVIPGKVSGVPLVVGTRIPADVIVKNFDAGSPIEEIEENYPALSRKTITSLLSCAESRRLQTAL
jgi:uncharacterized protein (DUF433 family)